MRMGLPVYWGAAQHWMDIAVSCAIYEIVSSLAPAPELPFSPETLGTHTPLPSSPGHGIGLPSPRLGIEALFRYSPATERHGTWSVCGAVVKIEVEVAIAVEVASE